MLEARHPFNNDFQGCPDRRTETTTLDHVLKFQRGQYVEWPRPKVVPLPQLLADNECDALPQRINF